MMPLTPKQYEVMAYLRSCEVCPSYAEISEHVGLAGRSGASRLLDEIEARGFIKRKRNRARSIELTGIPLPAPEVGALMATFDRLDSIALQIRHCDEDVELVDRWLDDETAALSAVHALPNAPEYLPIRARAVGSGTESTGDLASLDLKELSAHSEGIVGEIVRQILVCVSSTGRASL